MYKSNEYKAAKKALEAEEKASAGPLKDIQSLKNGFKVAADRVDEKWENRKRRAELVLPRGRRCPICKLVKVDRIRWYNNICRSCKKVERKGIKPTKPKFVRTVMYEMDAAQMNKYSPKRVGELMKISNPWKFIHRTKLITPETHTALRKHFNIEFQQANTPYFCKDDSLTKARKYAGVSAKDFAKHCGWTGRRQIAIEEGVSSVTPEEILAIEKVLEELNES